MILVAAIFLLPSAARFIGGWLVTQDEPQPARAVVVLAGSLPFRAVEAAATYRAGWAGEVWITQGRRAEKEEQAALEELQIDRVEEHDYSRQILEARGVPAAAIQILPERNNDTADEVRSVARKLREVGGGRVIFVTSKFHTRRVKVLWKLLAADQPEAIVRHRPDDPFDPTAWWRRPGGRSLVLREYGGLLNAWAGFPISSQR